MSIELIKELRDATGLSVMQCKKALEETNGDIEKALMLLKKKSSDAATKKADRDTGAGRVAVASSEGKTAVITLYCETDFVAKNDDFVTLANDIAAYALANGKEALEANATELINPLIQKIGENMKLGQVDILEGETIGSYIHNGAIAVAVNLQGGNIDLAKDIAMHISAMKPSYLTKEDVPAEALQKAKETFGNEVDTSKPADIQEKILQGKIDSYFKEQTLMEQTFIKDPSKSIKQLLSEKNATLTNYVMHSI
jgi:elongation factor Ts